MVVGHGVVVGGDLAARSVQARGARIDGQVAAHAPRGTALLEVRQGLAHGAPPNAGVVAHPLPDEHRTLVAQTRIAGGAEPTARLPVADRVGLELGAVATHELLTPPRIGAFALPDH